MQIANADIIHNPQHRASEISPLAFAICYINCNMFFLEIKHDYVNVSFFKNATFYQKEHNVHNQHYKFLNLSHVSIYTLVQ